MYQFKKSDVLILTVVIIFAIISILIIKNFIIPLIFSFILTYIYYPAYKKINRIVKNHFITSSISILLILLLLIVPLFLTITELSDEFSELKDIEISDSIEDLNYFINNKYNFKLNLNEQYQQIIDKANDMIKNIIYNRLPEFFFHIFIIVFFFYYFLKNFETDNLYLKNFISKKSLDKWSGKIDRLLNGIVYGQLLVRLIQSIIAIIGFILIGLKGAIIWGILIFFAAFIPFIGTGLIWIPLIIIKVLQEDYNVAIWIFIIGLIVSLVDNFLLPYFISEKTNIGPVTTLISILGGLELFGIYGIVLGPFFLGIFFVTFEEAIIKLRQDHPEMKRYIWDENERKKYRKLKTKQAKEHFIDMMHKKYEKEEMKGNKKVKFRYV